MTEKTDNSAPKIDDSEGDHERDMIDEENARGGEKNAHVDEENDGIEANVNEDGEEENDGGGETSDEAEENNFVGDEKNEYELEVWCSQNLKKPRIWRPPVNAQSS